MQGIWVVPALVSVVLFSLNGLTTDFAFDDHLAITGNQDVVNASAPLSQLLQNDFWGQGIHKPDSHKSFRPLTVLTFRLNYLTTGLSVIPFHLVNIVLHAAVSALVTFVYLAVFPASDSSNSNIIGALIASVLFAIHPVHVEAVTGLVGRAEMLSGVFYCIAFLAYHKAVSLTAPPSQSPTHPHKKNDDHLEQNASSVHPTAATTEDATKQSKRQQQDRGASGSKKGSKYNTNNDNNSTSHDNKPDHNAEPNDSAAKSSPQPIVVESDGRWRAGAYSGLLLLIVVVCYFAAVLSKETGFTVLGVVAAYEALHFLPRHRAILKNPFSLAWVVIRCLVIVLSAAAYLYLRTKVTKTFTLHNYRFLENPIAYTHGLTRVLSTAHLHAFYAMFLVWPSPMCADWSFNAVPLVDDVADVRNLRTVVVFATALGVLLHAIGPISRLKNGVDRPAIVLMVAWGVFAFFPASNILFPVGTMVAERLLYMPSLPFCVLIGHVSAVVWDRCSATPPSDQRAERNKSKRQKEQKEPQDTDSSSEDVGPSLNGRQALFIAACVCLVASASWVTDSQNVVWATEETLFLHAHQNCGGSAKTHQNTGILYRRKHDYEAALAEFNKALDILPSYCDVHWLRGLTHYEIIVSKHGTPQQREMIERGLWAGVGPSHVSDFYLDDFDQAVRCKYTARLGSQVMELIVDSRLRGPEADNSTLNTYAGNLMHTHGHYDKACEHWALAIATERSPLSPSKRAVITNLTRDVVTQIKAGCPCTPLVCPNQDVDCTAWAHIASLALSGQISESIALLHKSLPSLPKPDPLLAARLSKLLFIPDMGRHYLLAMLPALVALDPINEEYSLALITQYVYNKQTRAAIEEWQRVATARGSQASPKLRESWLVLKERARQEGIVVDQTQAELLLKAPQGAKHETIALSPERKGANSKRRQDEPPGKTALTKPKGKGAKFDYEKTPHEVMDNNWVDSDA